MNFLLKYTAKNNTGEVAQSMGSFMDSKCHKGRGLAIEEVGTLVSLFDNLGEQYLYNLFRARPLAFCIKNEPYEF